MANKQQHTKSRSKIWLLAWLLAVACVNFVPRQGWNSDHGPVVPHDSFPADCTLCHVGGNWHTLRADFVYDHEAETGVALEGAHKSASCLLCHNDRGPVAQYAARGCSGCHADPHLTRLGANCSDCHEQRSWYPRAAIAEHDRTRFPLVGAHAAVACFRCHAGAEVGNFAGAPADCRDCHQSDYGNTTTPNHAAVGFSRQCRECHVPTGWQPARFDHPNNFPLSQGHAALACAACHTTPNVFAGLSSDCATCHTDDFLAATDPNHNAAGFALQCDSCHDTRTFSRAQWPHPAGFELTRGHAGRRCGECHINQVYAATQTDCASCHLDDYQATSNPSHVSFGLSQTCQECHSTTSWGTGNWQHQFPINGGDHGGLACFDCHNQPANRTLFSCIDCHEHNAMDTNDDHDEVPGYTYTTAGCYSCHPSGKE